METKYIEKNNKFRIACFESYNPNSKVGIILIHGLAEHKGRYEYFIEKMYDRNMSVFAVDIRGHGESGGRRGDVDDFSTYLADLDSVVTKIKSDYPNLKLALLGHSLGGLIATGYVESKATIDYLILSNPLLVASKAVKLFSIIPYKLLSFIKFKKRHSESAEMLAYSYRDPLSSNYFSLRLLGVIFNQGLKFVLKRLIDAKIPILILGGKLDPLVQTNSFESLLSHFGSADKSLKIYDNVKHRLFQSDIKDVVMDDVVIWLNERVQQNQD